MGITFSIDEDNLLTVSAQDLDTKEESTIEVSLLD